MNPIYIEYYPHEHGDCYKINLPWSQYRKHTMILCPVSDGIETAQKLALVAIIEHTQDVLKKEIKNEGK